MLTAKNICCIKNVQTHANREEYLLIFSDCFQKRCSYMHVQISRKIGPLTTKEYLKCAFRVQISKPLFSENKLFLCQTCICQFLSSIVVLIRDHITNLGCWLPPFSYHSFYQEYTQLLPPPNYLQLYLTVSCTLVLI